MSQEPRKPRILVIDDDKKLQELVVTLLRRANMEPLSALNAREAVQILRKPPTPDMILLDLLLPEISGIDFLKQLRAKPVFDNLPVIILSAIADPDEIRAGLAAGADRYLTKPYLATNLVKTVIEVLKRGRVKRQPTPTTPQTVPPTTPPMPPPTSTPLPPTV